MTVHVHPHISVHPHVTPHVHITPHSVPHTTVPHATPHVTPRTAPKVAPSPHAAPHVGTPHSAPRSTSTQSPGMGITHPLHPLNPFPWSVWRRHQPAAETQAHTAAAVQPQPEQPADYFGVKIIAGIALATALVLLALWGLKHAGK